MVEAGKVEFGIAAADEVVLARDRGTDIVAVFATYQTNPQGIMVHAVARPALARRRVRGRRHARRRARRRVHEVLREALRPREDEDRPVRLQRRAVPERPDDGAAGLRHGGADRSATPGRRSAGVPDRGVGLRPVRGRGDHDGSPRAQRVGTRRRLRRRAARGLARLPRRSHRDERADGSTQPGDGRRDLPARRRGAAGR